VIVTLVALTCLVIQILLVGVPRDGQVLFWGYVTAGLPLMFFGYFLLGVPTTLVLTRLLAGVLSKVLGLPARLLARTVEATPYRHGLTAGALMGGLALMVALWTNGGAFLRDWIDKIQFPDAFVSGLALSPQSQKTLDRMTDIVERTCAITLHPVETDAFGVRALQRYKTTFMAFEPEPFFAMMNPTWVEGDPRTAMPKLERGGAVIVAREFLIARGMGVGGMFRCRHNERDFEFEIVGVVTSPGLEVVSKFFNIGEDYTDQALHAVFGSRKDLKEKFGSDAVHLIQIDLKEGVDDEAALARFREALFGQILDAGSGRQVKEFIRTFAGGGLLLVTGVAVAAMLVACFGVANVIIAGIQARQFEFGVLRAVGAQRGLLSRLVLGEALLIALAACVLGTLMGVQGSWAGQRIDRLLFGLDMRLRPPPLPIAVCWGITIALTLAAAGPPVLRLARKRPRELLGAVRG
jgi:putative ABC transport system permease protein